MAKQAGEEEIDRWRRDYQRLRKKYFNKAIAQKLGVNPANLSACVKGSKNPGEKFIKKFYMVYPELVEPPDDHPTGSNANKGQQGSRHEEPTSGTAENSAADDQMDWEDP